MIIFDTNVIIYASDSDSSFHDWARHTLSSAVADGDAAITAVILAELSVGDPACQALPEKLKRWGLVILDIPYAASMICGEAYRLYSQRRLAEAGTAAPKLPLPDFFIGAHCQLMGWRLATADAGRFKTYFPSVELVMPQRRTHDS